MDPANQDPNLFQLSVECNGPALRLDLNDIPVTEHSGGGRTRTANVNPYVIDGENHLSLRLAVPEGVPSLPPASYVRIMLRRGATRLYQFDWERERDGFIVPPGDEARFLSGTNFGRWAWQDARPVDLQSDLQGIRAYVNFMLRVLRNRDVNQFMFLTELKSRETARSLHLNADQSIAQSRQLIENVFNSPAWSVPPVDVERLNITVVAGGLMAVVTSPEGNEPIEAMIDAQGTRFALPLRLAFVRGQWTLVR